MPSLDRSSSSPNSIKPTDEKRYREFEKIVKSLPSPDWLLDTEDFFASNRQRPKWDSQVVTFANGGMCKEYRSYFDRWRDFPSWNLVAVGKLRSTWLLENSDQENGLPCENKNSSENCLPVIRTPRSKYIIDGSLGTVKKWVKKPCRPDLVGGMGYGSKYNGVTHLNFREYFGVHKKHLTLETSVLESLAANERASFVKMKKLRREEEETKAIKSGISLPAIKKKSSSCKVLRHALRDWITPVCAVNPSPRHRRIDLEIERAEGTQDLATLGKAPEVLENTLFKDPGWVDRLKK